MASQITTNLIVCLTHWGRVTHICVGKLTILGSDNGLSPGRRQAIIWTNAGILSIGPLGTNFSEILIKLHAFLCKNMHLKMSSGKWRPSCLGLNVLTACFRWQQRKHWSYALLALCEGNPPVIDGFPSWRVSNTEGVCILWCYHEIWLRFGGLDNVYMLNATLLLSQLFSWMIESVMMTSSNGTIFRVTGPLCREFTSHLWIPLTKASDAEL